MRSAGRISCIEFCWVCCRFEESGMNWLLLLTLMIEPGPKPGVTTRIKELVSLEGVRDNQLIGYGIVVGLAGTGDKQLTLFSTQSLTNMLKRLGVTVDPTQMQVRNMASVMVSANLPPFAQPGTRIDV